MSRARHAFSLLEVLVVIALVTILFGSMYAFVSDLLSSRARALQVSGRHLAAATLIDAVESDLATCLVGDTVAGAGVEGDAARLLIRHRGVSVNQARLGQDNPRVFADLQATEYRFNRDSGRIEVRTVSAGEPDAVPVGGPVHEVRFRYRDGTGWRDSYDSLEADRLPVAVEIAVWFDPWPGAPVASTGEGFDEQAFAAASDVDLFDEPMPDRIRVIPVPGAGE